MGIWAKLKQAKDNASARISAQQPPDADTTDGPAPNAEDDRQNLEVFASEILDEKTCLKCAHIDEHQYETLAQARADYPEGGGYKDCESESGCRGTLVFMYEG